MQHIYPKMETKVNICFSFLFFSSSPPSNNVLIPLTHILGLETIAAHFTEPEKEYIVDNTIYFDYKVKERPFFTVFTILSVMMRMEEEGEEEKEQGLEEGERRER